MSEATASGATPAIELDGVGVRFGGLVALRDVSLKVPAGAIYGLIGPNGAGKSTLFNAISGLVPVATGRIRLGGVDVTGRPARVRAGLGVQRTFQSIQLIASMTVLENIMTGLHVASRESRSGPRGDAERASAIGESLGLGEKLRQTTDSLTFYEQRHVEIARALVASPRVVMLDEPAAGLSAPEVDELRELLLRMQAQMKFAILLVEHVISLVMQMCDQVTVLEHGSVIAVCQAPELMSHPEVVRAYLGEEVHA